MFRIVVFMLSTVSLLVADSGCQALTDANNKLYSVPAHIYKTSTGGFTAGATRQSESIFFNGKTYIMTKGKWMVSPFSVQKMRATGDPENTAGGTCRRVGDDAVNGEAATIYTTHRKTESDTIETKTWISKSRGLPLKSEVDIDVGMGAQGKSYSTIRYEYDNVRPPI